MITFIPLIIFINLLYSSKYLSHQNNESSIKILELFSFFHFQFSFTRLALCLLVLQYLVEAVFHGCRLLSYAEKLEVARPLYRVHDGLFVLARLGSITLAVLTFWYGLALAPVERQVIDLASGTFNTSLFRLNALVAVCCLQVKILPDLICLLPSPSKGNIYKNVLVNKDLPLNNC